MMRLNKIFGLGSILIGSIIDAYIIFSAFFIDYFSHPGFVSRIGLFVCFSILIVAGIFLMLKKKLSISLYLLFSLCIIFDRIIVYLIFDEFLPLEEYLAPFLSVILVLFFFLHFHLKKTYPKLTTNDFE